MAVLGSQRSAAALGAVLRQLQRYRQRGLLDADSFETLHAALRAEVAAH
jgi:hypothetical protein